jgi:hypothetical protein
MLADQFPYLAANLIALPFLGLALIVAGPQRRATMASGVLCTPAGFLSPFLADYWSPARLGGWPVGVEDFLISFQTGAWAWFLASLPWRNRLQIELNVRLVLLRAAPLAFMFCIGMWLAGFVGISGMTQAILLPTILAAGLLVHRPELWRLALAASLIYGTIYPIVLWSLLAMWPHMALDWRSDPPWTSTYLGLPLGDIVWTFVGAPAHVLTFAFVTQARFVANSSPDILEPPRAP